MSWAIFSTRRREIFLSASVAVGIFKPLLAAHLCFVANRSAFSPLHTCLAMYFAHPVSPSLSRWACLVLHIPWDFIHRFSTSSRLRAQRITM